jgi:tetratricopeptide (TPR) repeat protein
VTDTPQNSVHHARRPRIAPRTLPLLLGLLAAVQLALVPRPVMAEDEAAGRRHWDRGQELYKLGRYLEAAREFEAGYQVAPRSNFLLNVGHSYRRAQELRRAKTAYETFLKIDPASAHRPMVEDLIRTIDDAISAQSEPPVTSPPRPATAPTTPAPPPLATGAPPPPAPVPSTPAIDLTPVPNVTQTDFGPTPDADSSSSLFRSPWFWGAVGAVLVAGVAGTVYGLSRGSSCSADRCFSEMPR